MSEMEMEKKYMIPRRDLFSAMAMQAMLTRGLTQEYLQKQAEKDGHENISAGEIVARDCVNWADSLVAVLDRQNSGLELQP